MVLARSQHRVAAADAEAEDARALALDPALPEPVEHMPDVGEDAPVIDGSDGRIDALRRGQVRMRGRAAEIVEDDDQVAGAAELRGAARHVGVHAGDGGKQHDRMRRIAMGGLMHVNGESFRGVLLAEDVLLQGGGRHVLAFECMEAKYSFRVLPTQCE